MNTHRLTPRFFLYPRAWLGAAALLIAALASPAGAQDDPPGRVGRLADLQGGVSWFDAEQGQWLDAERNRPLTSGDRLSTTPQGRAELRIGSTVLRLAGGSELEVLRLDDQRLSFQLHSGSLALRVRSREVADEIDIVTAEARLMPLRSGHYRVDRIDDSTQAASWRGDLRIDDAAGFVIVGGQRAELWREGPARTLRFAWTAIPNDNFANAVQQADARDERSVSSRYVSPEMTGAEELDRHGRWDRHPEHGAVWYPQDVRVGWAPYRFGRWSWVGPWGWTWVDEAAWGFAPFHYGRWVSLSGRWGWVPGVYVPRPVFAPALVAWIGGSHGGVSIGIGGPHVGWVPLAPREVYVPHYRHSPHYGDRINVHPPHRGHDRRDGHDGPRPPPMRAPQVPTGPVMYGNQGVPGAVTVVPRDVLLQRQPVPRSVSDGRPQPHSGALPALAPVLQPMATVAPPPRPAAPTVVGAPADRQREAPAMQERPRDGVGPARWRREDAAPAAAAPMPAPMAAPIPAPMPAPVTAPVKVPVPVMEQRRERAPVLTPSQPPAQAAPAAPATRQPSQPAVPAAPVVRQRPAEPEATRANEPREERSRAPESRQGQRERDNQR